MNPSKRLHVSATLKTVLPFLCIFPLALVLVHYLSFRASIDETLRIQRAAIVESENIISLTNEMAFSDLAYFSELRSFKNYLASKSDRDRRRLESDIVRFMEQRRIYDQLRLLDTEGREVFRIDTESGRPAAVPAELLQNKSNRYYTADIGRLEPGQYYISPFDLNVEMGEIQTPIKPVIRYGSKIVDDELEFRGMFVSNLLGQRIINEISNLADILSGQIWLANADGYFMIGPDPAWEWAFMYPDRETGRAVRDRVGVDAWNRMVNAQALQQMRQGGELLTFKRVNINSSSAHYKDGNWVLIAYEHLNFLSPAYTRHYVLLIPAGLIGVLWYWIARRRALQKIEMDNKLRESESRFRTLVRSSLKCIIVCVDSQDRIIVWNEEAEKFFGLPREAVIDRRIMTVDLQWDWSVISKKVLECMSEKTYSERFEAIREVSEDRTQLLSMAVSPFFDNDRDDHGYLILAEDITHKKQTELHEQQLQKLQSIGQLASGIAHEINTPMQYVGDNTAFVQESLVDLSAMIEALREAIAALPDEPAAAELKAACAAIEQRFDYAYLHTEIPKAIAQTLQGIERVTTILRGMKDFSHPSQEQWSYVDLNRAIESTAAVCCHEWKHCAELHLELDGALLPVRCNGSQINEVFLNIIVNAAHAIEQRGAEAKGLIRIATTDGAGSVTIAISDTGAGIPAEHQQRLFDPFFTTKGVGKGTGQGLAISHAIVVNQHHGKLYFKTVPGEGSTFYIELPKPQA